MEDGAADVPSTATDEVPLSDPSLPQPNAWLPMGPTENDVAFLRQLAVVFSRLRSINRALVDAPNTPAGRSAETRHSDVDSNADAGGADDDDEDEDAYGGFGAVPASGVAIACLPETTVGVGGECGDEARESEQCAVCLDEYEAGDVLRTMPCAHGFHERCIFGWLLVSRLCPLCRFPLPAEEPAEEEDMATDTDDVVVELEVGRDDHDQGEADDDDDGGDGALDTFERLFPT